jgi:hypothetical protein
MYCTLSMEIKQEAIKKHYDLSITKSIFIDRVIGIAENRKTSLDVTHNGTNFSATWTKENFGILLQNISNIDEGIFQACRSYILTLDIKIDIPSE